MQYNNEVSVENIIYGSFVKLGRLDQIVYDTFSNSSISSATEINIFVDLYSVLKSIFSEHYRTQINNYTDITSGIINLCSHYRRFFRKLQVKSNFFLIMSYNTCDINRKYVGNYNDEFKRKSEIKMFKELADNNFKLLNLLCPYLPDIHFIMSTRNYESSVIMANLIERYMGNGIPNLILSKDLYPLHLTAIYPYTAYLYPIKQRGGIDASVMVPINEKEDFVYKFWNLVGTVRSFNPELLYHISPINFPLVSAINKFPERGLAGMTNIRTIVRYLTKLAGDSGLEIFIQSLYNDEEISSYLPVNIIESRVKTLDTRFVLPMYKEDPECLSIKIENLVDNEALNKINSKFFANNPLDFNNL